MHSFKNFSENNYAIVTHCTLYLSVFCDVISKDQERDEKSVKATQTTSKNYWPKREHIIFIGTDCVVVGRLTISYNKGGRTVLRYPG